MTMNNVLNRTSADHEWEEERKVAKWTFNEER